MKKLIGILRFIKGYVVFKGEKGFVERFVNLCTKSGIRLWNVSVKNNILTAYVSISGFKKIRPLAHRSGIKIKIVSKHGLNFQYRRYNKRIGLAIGIVIFLLFHLIMNQFVWCTDVTGNNLVSKEEIVEKAQLHGLKSGTFKPSFDEVKAARKIASSYEGKIPWLSINIKGSMATIELRENIRKINKLEDNTPCNIIADFDGIILSVENYRGDAEVIVGNGVKKGDMLINGVIINEDLSTTYYKAKAKITAMHSKSVLKKEKISSSPLKPTVADIYYSLEIFGLKIPFGRYVKKENYICLSDKRYVYINGFKLPFSVEKNIVSEIIESNEKNRFSYYTEKFCAEKYYEYRNSTVISADESISFENNAYIFAGEYTLIDFIGKEKPILSEILK